MGDEHLMQTYGRLPIAFVRGEGVWLWDTEGRQYLDAISGVAVCNLGHAHPALAQAICDQAKCLLHTSNLYRIPLQEQLGERLCQISGMERAFFCNSGAEANEAAIKLARRHAHQQGIDTPYIMVMDGAFHGRTLATLTATGNRKIQIGFEPLVAGFVRAPYGDAAAARAIADQRPGIIAILVEPIQGEAGVKIPPTGYLQELRALCDEKGWLLMLDEVQTGMGRSGSWMAYQQENILPDVVTLAKALGNGVPIGACLARGAAAQALIPGSHGSTFGGNLLACRAALSVIDTLTKEHLPERAKIAGDLLQIALERELAGLSIVQEIRHRGLLVGIELNQPCPTLAKLALDEGILINITSERVIRLLPPLIISDDQIQTLATGVRRAINRFMQTLSE